jgi:RNA:NAD 2'-phosphotransferase (TPT1/KptA family)
MLARLRCADPVILEIDAETARKKGFKFYKATRQVYLANCLPPEYIRKTAGSARAT